MAVGVIFGGAGFDEAAFESPLVELALTLAAACIEFWLLGYALIGRLPGARRSTSSVLDSQL